MTTSEADDRPVFIEVERFQRDRPSRFIQFSSINLLSYGLTPIGIKLVTYQNSNLEDKRLREYVIPKKVLSKNL